MQSISGYAHGWHYRSSEEAERRLASKQSQLAQTQQALNALQDQAMANSRSVFCLSLPRVIVQMLITKQAPLTWLHMSFTVASGMVDHICGKAFAAPLSALVCNTALNVTGRPAAECTALFSIALILIARPCPSLWALTLQKCHALIVIRLTSLRQRSGQSCMILENKQQHMLQGG